MKLKEKIDIWMKKHIKKIALISVIMSCLIYIFAKEYFILYAIWVLQSLILYMARSCDFFRNMYCIAFHYDETYRKDEGEK